MVNMTRMDIEAAVTHHIDECLDIIIEYSAFYTIIEKDGTPDRIVFGALESINDIRDQHNEAVEFVKRNYTEEQIFLSEQFQALKSWLLDNASTTQAVQLITFSKDVLAALNIDQSELFSHSVGRIQQDIPANIETALTLAESLSMKPAQHHFYPIN